jgi:hypothetical protein
MDAHFRLIKTSETGDVFCDRDMHVRITRMHDSKDGKDFRIATVICICAANKPVMAEQVPA